VEANGREFDVRRAGVSWPATHLADYDYELVAVNCINLFFRKIRYHSRTAFNCQQLSADCASIAPWDDQTAQVSQRCVEWLIVAVATLFG
jgi:hypothetical protein